MLVNVLKAAIPENFLDNLPAALKCIDWEQQTVLADIRASDAPLHLVHALAGTGKSTDHASAPGAVHRKDPEVRRIPPGDLAQQAPAARILGDTAGQERSWKPRTCSLQGKLPDWLIESGVTDDDAAHFAKQIQKLPPVEKAKKDFDESKLSVEEVWDNFQKKFRRRSKGCQNACNDAWGQSRGLKVGSQKALKMLWEYINRFGAGAEEVLKQVSVLLATTDVALKLFADLSTPSSPAARLLKHQKPYAILMDEIQRVPTETFLGLAMHTPTLCAFGDNAQKVVVNSNP